VAVWFVAPLAFVALAISPEHGKGATPGHGGNTVRALLLAGLVLQFVCFFWGGHHLTKAKGYLTSIVFLGLMLLVVMFVLPDKSG